MPKGENMITSPSDYDLYNEEMFGWLMGNNDYDSVTTTPQIVKKLSEKLDNLFGKIEQDTGSESQFSDFQHVPSDREADAFLYGKKIPPDILEELHKRWQKKLDDQINHPEEYDKNKIEHIFHHGLSNMQAVLMGVFSLQPNLITQSIKADASLSNARNVAKDVRKYQAGRYVAQEILNELVAFIMDNLSIRLVGQTNEDGSFQALPNNLDQSKNYLLPTAEIKRFLEEDFNKEQKRLPWLRHFYLSFPDEKLYH